MAVSQPLLSGAVAVVCAAVVVTTLATSGRTVGAERAVLARIDDAGTRTIQLIDDRAAPEFGRICWPPSPDWTPRHGRSGSGRSRTSVRPPWPVARRCRPAPWSARRRTCGWLRQPAARLMPRPTALVGSGSQRRLGLAAAAGTVESVEGRQYAVVGAFTAGGPLSDLQDSVLLTGVAPDVPLRRITVEARTADLVLPLAMLLRGLVGPGGEGGVGIEISADLVQAQQAVRGELAGYSRAIVLQALGAGLLLMAGAVLTGVNARRRDFGRRRALGAARGQLAPGPAGNTRLRSPSSPHSGRRWPPWRRPVVALRVPL